MTTLEMQREILAFAGHIDREAAQTPEIVACRRNWLSPEGAVTPDGEALALALRDQFATRTVFRGNF